MGSSRVGRAVLVGGFFGVVFASCAQGNQLMGVGGGGVGGGVPTTSTTSGKPDAGRSGQIGSACMTTSDCKEGSCMVIGTAKYCTTSCPPACPLGTYCSIVQGFALCVPDLGQQCEPCETASNCKLPSDACLTGPQGEQFCAEDCTIDGLCPSGYVCMNGATYESDGGVEGGAGGAGGAGGGAVGAGGGFGVGGAGGAGGGGPLPTTPTRWCVPQGSQSCPCDESRNGATSTCTITNANGTCTGTQTCDGKAGQYKGCTAKTPAAETCNGKDDDCDGLIDEGDPNSLCMAKGPPPLNATWACSNGACGLGACNMGFAAYPPGSKGCPCQVDTTEPNDTCAMATMVGPIDDTSAAPLVLTGTLSSDTDVDVYAFNTTDSDEAGMMTNSYHVAINFTQPMPNSEFVMDVERGGPCLDGPTGGGTAVTSYDWCVNAASATAGEAPCGPTAATHCTDHSSQYYVRVYRKPGVTGTCTQYQITVTGGGGSCDLTQTCP